MHTLGLQARRWIISIKDLLNYVKNAPSCLSVFFSQPWNQTKIKEKVETFSRLQMPTSQSRLNNKLIYNKFVLLSTSLISIRVRPPQYSPITFDGPVSILGLCRISVSTWRNHRQSMFVKRRIFIFVQIRFIELFQTNFMEFLL